MLTYLRKQIKRSRQAGGLRYTFMRMLHSYIPTHLFHARRFLIIARELRHPSYYTNAATPDARPATQADVRLLSQCGYPQFILNQWLERDARAWLVEREGELLSCYWLNGAGSYFLYNWLAFDAAEQDVWILWWWVNGNYRKQGFGDQVRLRGIAEYATTGFTHILSAVDVLNKNAVERCNKFGLETIGRLFVLRILGVTVVRFGRSWHIGRWTAASPLHLSLAQ